jgi:hypothetical protein
MNFETERRYRRGAIDFAIRLSRTDPVTLVSSEQPGDLPNLIHDLYRFGFLWPVHDLKDEADRLVEALRKKPSLLHPALQAARELLAAAASGGLFEWIVHPRTKFVFDGASKAASTPRTTISHPRVGLRALQQAVVWRLGWALDSVEGEMVRMCSRDGCSRVFLAARPKQIYCTRRCASAAVFERYKQKLGVEEYRRIHAEAAGKSADRARKRRKFKLAQAIGANQLGASREAKGTK